MGRGKGGAVKARVAWIGSIGGRSEISGKRWAMLWALIVAAGPHGELTT